MRSWARINPQGRIVIPAECRAAAGLKPGDELMIEPIGEGGLRLRTRSSNSSHPRSKSPSVSNALARLPRAAS